MVMTMRMSPITVKQTPTMAAETVKMWMQISSSRPTFCFGSGIVGLSFSSEVRFAKKYIQSEIDSIDKISF